MGYNYSNEFLVCLCEGTHLDNGENVKWGNETMSQAAGICQSCATTPREIKLDLSVSTMRMWPKDSVDFSRHGNEGTQRLGCAACVDSSVGCVTALAKHGVCWLAESHVGRVDNTARREQDLSRWVAAGSHGRTTLRPLLSAHPTSTEATSMCFTA